MAVSDSTNFDLPRDTLITNALRLIGVVEEGTEANSDQLTEGASFLNIMLKAMMAHGLNLWVMKQGSINPPVAGTGTYTMGLAGADITMARPLAIDKMVYRNTSTSVDVPMTRLSRDEYWRLSDKTTSGIPSQYYFDPQHPLAKVSIWPVPDATFASDYTLEFVYQKPYDDMDSAADSLDFPPEWYEAIMFGLAVRLAQRYLLPLQERYLLRKEAQDAMDLALAWDTERESVFFTVDLSNGTR